MVQANDESQTVLCCAGSNGTVQLGISRDGGTYLTMSHTTEGGEQASVTLSVGQPLQLRTWYYIRASVEWEAPCVVVEQMQLKNGKRDQMTAQSHSLDLSASSFERVRETPLSLLSRLAPVRGRRSGQQNCEYDEQRS